jgi:hypothetical protein
VDRTDFAQEMVTNEIRSSLQKICSSLNRNEVDYLIIGGVAVGFYGYQRISGGGYIGTPEITHDIDFWYNPSASNYTKLVACLDELNIDTQQLKQIVFDPKKTYLRIPFDTFKAEFLPEISGVPSFLESKKNASKVELDGNLLYIISFKDLIKNKETAAREIDKRDIEELKSRNTFN